MKIIRCLSEQIEQELDAAEEYAKKAIQYKEDYPATAKVLLTLSTTHLDNIKMLHEQVATLIANVRKEKGDPPMGMQTLYEYLHERHIDKAAAIRNLQDLFNKNYQEFIWKKTILKLKK